MSWCVEARLTAGERVPLGRAQTLADVRVLWLDWLGICHALCPPRPLCPEHGERRFDPEYATAELERVSPRGQRDVWSPFFGKWVRRER